MATRKPPTRDEVISTLDTASRNIVGLGLDRRAVPYAEAVQILRTAFTTTRKMAQAWLDGGVVDGTPECPLLMVHGLDSGSVYTVLGPNVRHDGRSLRKIVPDQPDSALVWATLDTIGYDIHDNVQLDHRGAYVSGGRPLDSTRPTSKDWIVLRSTFAWMVTRSQDDRAATAAKHRERKAADETEFTARYPGALETFRALLASAGNPLHMSGVRVSRGPGLGSDLSSATITLYNEDIDAVAAFLRERGVGA